MAKTEREVVLDEIGALCAKHNCTLDFVIALVVLLNRLLPGAAIQTKLGSEDAQDA